MPAVPYPSDLSDHEWQLLAPLLPPAKPGGHPRTGGAGASIALAGGNSAGDALDRRHALGSSGELA